MPKLTMGQRPDGSPWMIHADFGYEVSIDSYGQLSDRRKRINANEARSRANALLEAAEWLDTERTKSLEEI
jgi:hypothetical protein